ncbi:MAG: hypothetical protein H6R07_1911 [Proteobacteria bacterium]|nr:hypothetical protein [Pseudomonadota bacterium]
MLDALLNMPEAAFTRLTVAIFCTGLIVFMGFIIYRLAKDSKAGKIGTLVLFFVLGLGVFGFIIKTLLTEVLQK